MSHASKHAAVRCCAILSLFVAFSFAVAGNGSAPANNGPGWQSSANPARLPNVPLDRLSSGALLRLDVEGDLVEPADAWQRRVEAASQSDKRQAEAAVALDRRVGANIRLGDDPAALPTEFRSQAEPHIARAPNNPDFVIATFQEGRFSNGGAADCGYAVTHDGGLTWRRALIPNLARPSGGTFDRATDPVAGIDRNGVTYLNTLALLDTNPRRGIVVVSRSNDGGNSWTNPMVAYSDPSGQFFPDKNWMAVNSFADTLSAGRILVTFTLFPNTSATNHPIMRVISDDGGATWGPAEFIHSSNRQVQGSQPLFLRDGRVVIPYWNFNNTGSFADDFLEMVVSNDGGQTFATPKLITPVAIYNHPQVRDGAFLPSATTDRTTNTVYVTYQAVHQGSPRIMFTKSSNAGDSWTTPIPISDNPSGRGVFNPAIGASPDGQTLTVAFYDVRDNPTSNTLVDMYLAQSLDGGATWQPNIRLTTVSTDATLAVNTGTASNPNYMLGDYIGIAESTDRNVPAIPVWVDTRTGNPDPFVTRVGIAPQVDFTSWQAARLSLGQINDPQLGGESGDADRDFEDNLSEFRSGTEPNDPASVFRTGRQLNISTRAQILTGDNVLIGGFIVTGDEPKRVVLRAIGPSLGNGGVRGALQDPTLELFAGSGSAPVATNDNWKESQRAEIEASGIPPGDDREAAIVQTLAPGNYTAVVRGKAETVGVGLVEIYDLSRNAGSRLANVSSRGFVGTDDSVMIGGFIVGAGQGADGAGSARVLLRGIGPSLNQTPKSGVLVNPELLLVDGNGSIIAANDDWRQNQEAEIQASGIAPSDDRESALIAVLPDGNYTAIVRGRNRTSGVALVEAYNVQ
ncbi:MAG TPA: sialidase family protein [Chthoniobacterales bacterium]|nr:sialidase family protein [Chthoniobacterales bacterium]